MYTIKQAAAMSGVGAPLIRAWERRYRVVSPQRTASGYRLYDDATVDRLRAMRALIAAGWSAAQAAQGLLDGELAVEEWAGRAVGGGLDARRGRGQADDDLGAALVDAAAVYDTSGVEAALDEMFARGSFEAVVDDLILPAAVALGEAWAAGRVDVAGEHMASAAITRRLAMAYTAASRAGDAAQILVGLPPDSRHELGALAFAVALRRRGIGVLYLGADVPIASWVDAATRTGVRAAVVGAITHDDVPAADAVCDALRAARPELIVAIGGRAASLVHGAPDGQRVLAGRVTDAAADLARTLANPRA